MKEGSCYICGSDIGYLNGYCLDAVPLPDEELRRRAEIRERLLDSGLEGAVVVRPSGYFVCDACLEALHGEQGVRPHPIQKIMAKNQALYLGETGRFERPMRSGDFPPISAEKRLPWLDDAQERSWLDVRPGSPSEREFLAVRAIYLVRLLEGWEHPKPRYQHADPGREFVAIVAEAPPSGIAWDEYLDGFIQRRLLQDIRNTTVYCLSYTHAVWFSERMAPHVAVAVVFRAVGDSSKTIAYECYVSSEGSHLLVVVGPERTGG
jgi:hypothetical protein